MGPSSVGNAERSQRAGEGRQRERAAIGRGENPRVLSSPEPAPGRRTVGGPLHPGVGRAGAPHDDAAREQGAEAVGDLCLVVFPSPLCLRSRCPRRSRTEAERHTCLTRATSRTPEPSGLWRQRPSPQRCHANRRPLANQRQRERPFPASRRGDRAQRVLDRGNHCPGTHRGLRSGRRRARLSVSQRSLVPGFFRLGHNAGTDDGAQLPHGLALARLSSRRVSAAHTLPDQVNTPNARPTMRRVFPCFEGMERLPLHPPPSSFCVFKPFPTSFSPSSGLSPKTSLFPPVETAECGLCGDTGTSTALPAPLARLSVNSPFPPAPSPLSGRIFYD